MDVPPLHLPVIRGRKLGWKVKPQAYPKSTLLCLRHAKAQSGSNQYERKNARAEKKGKILIHNPAQYARASTPFRARKRHVESPPPHVFFRATTTDARKHHPPIYPERGLFLGLTRPTTAVRPAGYWNQTTRQRYGIKGSRGLLTSGR